MVVANGKNGLALHDISTIRADHDYDRKTVYSVMKSAQKNNNTSNGNVKKNSVNLDTLIQG